jgi:hypothetical protein
MRYDAVVNDGTARKVRAPRSLVLVVCPSDYVTT